MLLLALLSPFSPSFGPVLPESVVPGEDAGGGIVTWDNFLHLTFGNKLYIHTIQYNTITITYLTLKMTLLVLESLHFTWIFWLLYFTEILEV